MGVAVRVHLERALILLGTQLLKAVVARVIGLGTSANKQMYVWIVVHARVADRHSVFGG